jgi:hypothetical protein
MIGVHAYIQRPMTLQELRDTNSRPYVIQSLHGGKSLHPDGSHWVFGTVSEYVKSKSLALAVAQGMRTIPGVTSVEIVGRNIRRDWVRPH